MGGSGELGICPLLIFWEEKQTKLKKRKKYAK
jgi:hypothetical protein